MYSKQSPKDNGTSKVNGKHKNADNESDASELSQTSDVEPLDDDDEEDMKLGSDEEEKQPE